MALGRGLYELLVTEELSAALEAIAAERLEAAVSGLRPAEAADRIALHLGRVITRALEMVGDRDRVEAGVELARSVVALVDQAVAKAGAAGQAPTAPGRVLHGLFGRRPDGSVDALAEPLIPLLDTTLLTNAPGEPRIGTQIQAEIASADRIDVVMAFIRRSGIAPLLAQLAAHCAAGRPLRILTTTYTGSTEARALGELRSAGADIRVSYDTTSTRLHAKAWLFHRGSGFSTGYIGSSNLTHSAQVSGLEWNIRVSGARNPQVIDKVAAVFESYWQSGDFVPYDPDTFAERAAGPERGPAIVLSPIEIRLEPFQERLLEQIAVSRESGHHRNLLVSATGTGKTVMAAVDYARLRADLPRARLLFVAHREEILAQSLATFRHALRDASFGELWVGGKRPTRFEAVFASIQSLHTAGVRDLAASHFDVVIVDEFHHAAAQSYQQLLDHLQPRELLGLTATPERADGLPVLHWFGDRIAAELRLWDAIDQHRLVPFHYFGLSDGTDLREVPWRRGRGYDVEGLEKLFTSNDAWARLVLGRLRDHTGDPSAMRALGFCVSVGHARFMARVFTDHGISARAVWADTPAAERRAALADLAAGRIQILFSVDLFNEGVDLPSVDTLLLHRPTDSPVLFLQQLGRGLRRTPGKSLCTVLDFVGHHRREFRIDRRLRALLGGSRKDLEEDIERGFPFLPAGCHMQLDPVARELVLANIRAAVPTRWAAKVAELRDLAAGADASLADYLGATGLDLDDIYSGGRSWSDLRAAAGLPCHAAGPHQPALRRACGRLLHVDDRERLECYQRLLAAEQPPDPATLAERDRRLLRMLIAQLVDQVVDKRAPLQDGIALVWNHPQIRAELRELFALLAARVDHVHFPLADPSVPLQVHARYTRLEILAAFAIGDTAKVAAWQTGVRWIDHARADLLAFTLDKTSGQFSPTTRYRDYAVSRDLIHWESQSATRAESSTGRRYREHARLGSAVHLFARLRQSDRAFWFLGPARYVAHQGEQPMAITWRLEHALPGDLFATFAAAVA